MARDIAVLQPEFVEPGTRALRDEGTSYHYLPVADYAKIRPAVLAFARGAFACAKTPVEEGAVWTTGAPFREMEEAIAFAKREVAGRGDGDGSSLCLCGCPAAAGALLGARDELYGEERRRLWEGRGGGERGGARTAGADCGGLEEAKPQMMQATVHQYVRNRISQVIVSVINTLMAPQVGLEPATRRWHST